MSALFGQHGNISAHLRGIIKSERRGRLPKFFFSKNKFFENEAAMNLLGSEAAAKRQKLIDSPKKKNLVGFLALNRVSGAVSIVC
jgi:hypothetical protein